jgi:hypothetical protein
MFARLLKIRPVAGPITEASLIRWHTCHPFMVLWNANEDALMVGTCNWPVSLVRRPMGRLRNHHPAAHCGADETNVWEILQVDLVALGRTGTQNPPTGPARKISCRLRPTLGRAPAGRLGGVDNRRVHFDLPSAGAAISVFGRIGSLRRAALVVALSECLLIPLPSWIPAHRSRRKNDVSEELRPPTDLTVTPTINQRGQIHPADGLVDNLPGEAEL